MEWFFLNIRENDVYFIFCLWIILCKVILLIEIKRIELYENLEMKYKIVFVYGDDYGYIVLGSLCYILCIIL